jgi:hypothetical protein
MKTFYLKTSVKERDIIAKFECDDFEIACEYFSILKKLSIRDLLRIYVVVSKK